MFSYENDYFSAILIIIDGFFTKIFTKWDFFANMIIVLRCT